MKKIIYKIFLTLTLFLILFNYSFINISMAGSRGGGGSSGGGAFGGGEAATPGNSYTPSDHNGGGNSNNGDNSSNIDIKKTLYFYSSIAGYVFEDTKQIEEKGEPSTKDSSYTGMPTTNGIMDENEEGIANIAVNINGNTSYTSSGGRYSYSTDKEHESVSIGFEYSNLYYYDKSDDFKYNSQDYTSIYASSSNSRSNINNYYSYKSEIASKENGAAQVIIAIDNSDPMLDNKVSDEEDITRYEAVLEACRKLIDSLLEESNDSIYIGLVVFCGDSYRKMSLTNNKEVLYEALEDIECESSEHVTENLWFSTEPCTDFVSALKKAEESFIKLTEESTTNNHIILLSDGVPTRVGNIMPFVGESDEVQVAKVLNIVKPKTTQKFQELLEKNINIMAFLIEDLTGEARENELLVREGLFPDGVIVSYLQNEYTNIIETIDKEVKEKVFESSQEATTTTENYESYFSADDQGQREIVNELYNSLFYYRGIENFEKILIKDSSISRQSVVNFIDLIKMPVSPAGSYSLSNIHIIDEDLVKKVQTGTKKVAKTDDDGNYIYDEDGNIEYTTVAVYEDKHYYVLSDGTELCYDDYERPECGLTLKGPNLALYERNPSNMEISTYVTGVTVKLSNGQEIVSDVVEEAYNVEINGNYRNLRNVNEPIVYYLDNELKYGAQITVEYTIEVKNTSGVTFDTVEIATYSPEGLSYDENTKLITCNKTNKEYGWMLNDTSALQTNKILSVDNEVANKSNTCLTMELEGDNANIRPDGERYLKIAYSKILTNKDEDATYKCCAEILRYTNNLGVRMKSLDLVGNSFTLFPGDGLDSDFGQSLSVVVIPPTGLPNNINNLITILNTLIGILLILVIIKIRNNFKVFGKIKK